MDHKRESWWPALISIGVLVCVIVAFDIVMIIRHRPGDGLYITPVGLLAIAAAIYRIKWFEDTGR